MYQYEHYEMGSESFMDDVSVGDQIEVGFSIGNFHREKQFGRKDKDKYVLWIHKVRKL